MGMELIEGFEVHDFTFDGYNDLALYLGCTPETPYSAVSPFDANLTAVVEPNSGRVTNTQAMVVTRSANSGGSFDNCVSFGWDFVAGTTFTVGFAVKFSKQHVAPFPLMQLVYGTAYGSSEQLGLWVSSIGSVFLCEQDIVMDADLQEAPVPLASGLAPNYVFNVDVWNYIELGVDYSDEVPRISLMVNGEMLLRNIESAGFKKMPTASITGVRFISPAASYFYEDGVDDFTVTPLTYSLDDIVVHRGTNGYETLGPQHVMGVAIDYTYTDNGAYNDFTGTPAQIFEGTSEPSVSPPEDDYSYGILAGIDQTDIAALEGRMTGISVSGYIVSEGGLLSLQYGAQEGSGSLSSERFSEWGAANPDSSEQRYFRVAGDLPGNTNVDAVGDLMVKLSVSEEVRLEEEGA